MCKCFSLSFLIICQISVMSGLFAFCASLMNVSMVSYKKPASLPIACSMSYIVFDNSDSLLITLQPLKYYLSDQLIERCFAGDINARFSQNHFLERTGKQLRQFKIGRAHV